MGKAKSKNRHLPPRMIQPAGRRSYYYLGPPRGPEKKRLCIPLGADYILALLKYREIECQPDDVQTVRQMLDTALILMKPDLKPRSFVEFERAARTLGPAFAGHSFDSVTPQMIAIYLERRSAKVAANREIAFFSTAWDLARRRGWTNLPNPTAGIRRNPERKRKRIASADELRALLYGSDGTQKNCVEADMVGLSLMTAIRVSDMLSLTVSQADPKTNPQGLTVRPQKTDTSTEVQLCFQWTDELRGLVERCVQRARSAGSKHLFFASRGRRRTQPFTVNSFQTKWHRYFVSCSVEGLTWHDLRRTALNSKKRLEGSDAAQILAGHASITTTERYLVGVGETLVTPLALP